MEHFGEIMLSQKGIYQPIATVINFLMEFPDRWDVQNFIF